MQDVLTLPLPGLAPPRAYHGRVQSASDEVLARRAADGDESAFEELVVRYQDRLYTLALRITLSEADAYDCVQEGLVSAWRGLGSFRFNARFSTWMYRIVVRKAYDVLGHVAPVGVAAVAERHGYNLRGTFEGRLLATCRTCKILSQPGKRPFSSDFI